MATRKTTTWKVVGTEARPIEGSDGVVMMGMTLRCLEDDAEYIVTVSGIGTTPGANFINALRAAAIHIEHACGVVAPPQDATLHEVH